MVLHLANLDPLVRLIYNSRNFVWFYTHGFDYVELVIIYNSRNFVWFYTSRTTNSTSWAYLQQQKFCMVLHQDKITLELLGIYNSRNFVWFYTAYDQNMLKASTIVEILYGFTPLWPMRCRYWNLQQQKFCMVLHLIFNKQAL